MTTSTNSQASSPATIASQEPRRVPRLIGACGSYKHLNQNGYFWSGDNLETFCFNDRRGWRTPILYRHREHPREHVHKTTLDNIIDVFKAARPPMFIEQRGDNNSNCVPIACGWVLRYLDGSVGHAVAFREAMLSSFPPPPPPHGRTDNTFTLLEIFCIGIEPATMAKLECNIPGARVLAMMRVHHHYTIDQAPGFKFYGPDD